MPIIEKTEILGLHWEGTYRLRTGNRSGILVQNAGQENVSIVFHAEDFTSSTHGGYDVFGIHLGQSDVLTFLPTDDRVMTGRFVDCRKDSVTLHKEVVLQFQGNPDRALAVERGIAHCFDNLVGMVTVNQPRLYVDFFNPDFVPPTDVLNVSRDTESRDFPIVRVNRFAAPHWFCRLARRRQRRQIQRNPMQQHPFRFVHPEHGVVTFVPGVSDEQAE